MNVCRTGWIAATLLATIVAGCTDGGRGSSGFDISENAAISRVLETQECVSSDRLTLCPADQMPTPSPTAPTPTLPPGPTETPTPNTTQRIETGLSPDAVLACTRPDPDALCALTFPFRAISFAEGTTFGVASRLPAESTSWTLAPRPVADDTEPPGYATVVSLAVPADASTGRVQFAVLVFSEEPANVPEEFEVLADSGADLAFVTPEFALDVVTDEPPPTSTATEAPPSLTPTASPTPSTTPTASPSRTPAPWGSGPEITHLGLARADNRPMEPIGVDEEGRPIYFNRVPQGMTLIVEARPGPSGRQPGRSGYELAGLPDLHLIASQPLGDGSAAVCDAQVPVIGGVPETEPLEFADTMEVTDAINDFGCRVNDGTGLPLARVSPNDACTTSNGSRTGFGFVEPNSTTQFCVPIARAWAFSRGDTVVAARVRDVSGALGLAREIVVRIADDPGPDRPCDGDERLLTIARPASQLHTSYVGSSDVGADPWQEGPIRLCIGPEGVDGRRPIHLSADVTVSLGVTDGSSLCVHLESLGSGGYLDCSGGHPHDVVIHQDSHGIGLEGSLVVETGLGSDAGPGAATLTAPVALALYPAGTPPSRCATIAERRPPVPMASTTATGTARVDNPSPPGTVSIAAEGTPFDCSRLTETDSGGALVLPFPAVDTIVGDTANVLILAD